MVRVIKKIIAAPFVLLAAVIILLEDWLWDDLARFAAAIGRFPIFHQVESFVLWLPPYASLLIFVVPSLLLVPIKFLSLYLIAEGQAALGILIAVAAKIIGTASVARIFNLTKPKLLQINWFAFLYGYLTAFKKRIYGGLKSTRIYRIVHWRKTRFKQSFRKWRLARKSIWRRRWDAAKRFMRRSGRSDR